MVRTLSERVNRKIRLAVMSFLLMTESMPISSARVMYSRFSTSAMVLATPIFRAATQASSRILRRSSAPFSSAVRFFFRSPQCGQAFVSLICFPSRHPITYPRGV